MKDLLTIREIEHKGIKVLVEINNVTRKVSLVEQVTPGKFTPKDWLFSEQTVDYAKTWLTILEAMTAAVKYGVDELEKTEKEHMFETAKLITAVQEGLNNKQ